MSRRSSALWNTFAAILALGAQWFVPSVDGIRWWLNSHDGIVITVSALFAGGLLLGSTMPWAPWQRSQWVAAFLFWVSANVALAGVLFASGGSNLFPIVLSIGGALTFAAIAGGVAVGSAARGLGQLVIARA